MYDIPRSMDEAILSYDTFSSFINGRWVTNVDEYQTRDIYGNKVIVRYDWDHLRRVRAAKENVRRYCHG